MKRLYVHCGRGAWGMLGVLCLGVGLGAVLSCAAGGGAVSSAAAERVAGTLLVSLDAREASAGGATWVNKGSMGDFARIGEPKRETVGGQPAVTFNGTSDAYRSLHATPADLTGAHARSIEVWAFNPTIDSAEEALVSWGRRGTDFNNMSFNYGTGSTYSAVTHYGPENDMAWAQEPAAGRWHHLVYTYDGTTSKIYADGVEQGSAAFALETAADQHINIAAENSADSGEPQFASEFGDPAWQMSISGSIALVRVHGGALTPDQIKANFAIDAARFGAVAAQ